MLKTDDFFEHLGRKLPIRLCFKGGSTPSLQGCFREDIVAVGHGFGQLDDIYLTLNISTTIEMPCCRCLAPVCTRISLREMFKIRTEPTEDKIDLLPHILAAISASLDPHPLCLPNCRGLCPVCGINLNQHPEHEPHLAGVEGRKLADFL